MSPTSASPVPQPDSLLEPGRSAGNPTWLVTGAAVLAILCGGAVIALADGAREREGPAAWDPNVAATVVAERSHPISLLADVATAWGSEVGVTLTALLVVLLAARTTWGHRLFGGARRSATWIAVALVGSVTMTVVVKALVARHRPPAWMALGPPDSTYAFPSGHTLNSTTLFLTVAALVAWQATRRRDQLIAAGLGVGLSLAVGLSRVYLGYHWLTDVLAAWLLALGWLSLLVAVRVGWTMRTADQQPTGREAVPGKGPLPAGP